MSSNEATKGEGVEDKRSQLSTEPWDTLVLIIKSIESIRKTEQPWPGM